MWRFHSGERFPGLRRLQGVTAIRRALWTGTILAAIVLVALTGAAALVCNFSLHVPRRSPGPPPVALFPDADWREARIHAADRAVLEAWFVRPGTRPDGRCVIVLHGIADSRLGAAGFAPMFLAAGYSVLLPDSRGHGQSGGEFVTYGLLEKYDVLDWAHWMRGQGCTATYGLGESLGGSILIQAAAIEPAFRAAAAESAFADLSAAGEIRVRRLLPLPDSIAGRTSWLLVAGGLVYARVRYGLDLRQVAPVEAMRQTRTPILLIHGIEDQRTPCWHSERLAQANPNAVLWLVPKADHVSVSRVDPQGFRQRVLDWFARH